MVYRCKRKENTDTISISYIVILSIYTSWFITLVSEWAFHLASSRALWVGYSEHSILKARSKWISLRVRRQPNSPMKLLRALLSLLPTSIFTSSFFNPGTSHVRVWGPLPVHSDGTDGRDGRPEMQWWGRRHRRDPIYVKRDWLKGIPLARFSNNMTYLELKYWQSWLIT